MSLFKFSLPIVLIFIFLSQVALGFSDMECIKSNYKSSVSHKGKPFGLTENVLAVTKEQCVIRVAHEKMKVMKSHWVIDVCREPVHIKEGSGAVEILKREGECAKTNKSDYCQALKKLTTVLQDDGLIFAEGEKEDLKSEHGKIYCAYLLSKAYLEKGMIFSRHNNYSNILEPSRGSAPTRKNEDDVASPMDPNPTGKSGGGLFNF